MPRSLTTEKTPRSLTIKNLYDQREPKRVKFYNEVFNQAIGGLKGAEKRGFWIIYGAEKNGKNWLAYQLAKDLAADEKIQFISAESGHEDDFIQGIERAGITPGDKILIDDYMPINILVSKILKSKNTIWFIDNTTMYGDETKGEYSIKNLKIMLQEKLIIWLSHEERKEPSPACAREIKKLAKVIIHVKGLKAFVVSRFALQGGEITISDDMAEMYWG
jgi:KaiC/GvpD/RAD55 family RecA-like ATPase